ncbi:MAG: hypothetical protein BWX81_02118 [Spirochaetes bacterium ADurb.Bin110]|nr:MAG: hypothetical protein BWX81_02118 [Spirochaetes bacterium ADurb.Bin110]
MWHTIEHCSTSFYRRLPRTSMYITIVLINLLFSSCKHPAAQAIFDEAFMLLYPDLSQAVAREFPLESVASLKGAPQLLEKIIKKKTADNQSLNIFITSPSVAAALQEFASEDRFAVINLLAPANGFFSVEWDNAWAYQQLGLLAGYRVAALRKETAKDASAALLFARGIGRSDKELEVFNQAFREAYLLATIGTKQKQSSNEVEMVPKNALEIFDVDNMNLPGDRLEQALSVLRQIEEKKPTILIFACTSRLALERACEIQGIDIMADLRGLGKDISHKRLFAALGENSSYLIRALRNTAKEIQNGNTEPHSEYIRPDLILSKEARRIQQKLKP